MIQLVVLLVVVGLLPVLAVAGWYGIVRYRVRVLDAPGYVVVISILFLNLVPIGLGLEDGGGFKQAGWLFIFGLTFISFIRSRDGNALELLNRVPVLLCLLILYAAISTTWSDYPLTSFKRVGQVIGILIVAIILFRKTEDGIAMVRFSTLPIILFVTFGLLLALVAPSYSFDDDGAFRAMTSHKNTWGQFALFCSIVLLISIFNRRSVRVKEFPVLVLTVGSVFASRSSTSLVILIIVFTVFILLEGFRKSARLTVGGLFLITVIGLSIVLFCLFYYGGISFDLIYSKFMGVVGKSETLTGRTQIWDLMVVQISGHPFFGTGFGGFWVEGGRDAAWLVSRFAVKINQAHNGYLDLVNEIGIVGGVLTAIMLINHFGNILRLFRFDVRSAAYYHLFVAIAALLLNFSESSILRISHFWWVIFCFSIVEAHYSSARVRQINPILHRPINSDRTRVTA